MKYQFFTSMLLTAFLLSCNNEIAEFRHTVLSSTNQETSNYSYRKLIHSFKKKMRRNEIEKPIEQLLSLDSIWLSADIRLAKDDMLFADAGNYQDSVLLAVACTKEHYIDAQKKQTSIRHELPYYNYNQKYGYNQLDNNEYVIKADKYDTDFEYDFEKVKKDYQTISIPGVSVELQLIKTSQSKNDEDVLDSMTIIIKTAKGVYNKGFQSWDFAYPLKFKQFPEHNILQLPFFFDNMAGPIINMYIVDNILFYSACRPDYVTDDHLVVLSNYKKDFPHFFYFYPEVCVYDRSSYKVLDTNLDKIIFALMEHEYTPVFNEVVVNRISENYLPEYRNKYNGEICLEFNAEKNFKRENFDPNNQSIRIDTTFFYKILY